MNKLDSVRPDHINHYFTTSIKYMKVKNLILFLNARETVLFINIYINNIYTYLKMFPMELTYIVCLENCICINL